MATTKRTTRRIHPTRKIVLLAVLVILVILLAIIALINHHNVSKVGTVAPKLSAATDQKTTPTPSSTPVAKGYAATSGNLAPSSDSQLVAPTGQLLNLHTISLSADPAMESACQTAANISCDIQLTQGSVTKTVGAQSTGSNGIAIFDWTAQGIGLTTGQWIVEAVAMGNGTTSNSASGTLMVNP